MARSRAVAGPLRRFTRDRGRLAAVLLLAVTAIAASGLQTNAAAALQQTLNDNWRGAYDILVTSGALGGSGGSLLPPNSLADGASGMTLQQLREVRRIAGLDVAAPIGDVLATGQSGAVAAITLAAVSL